MFIILLLFKVLLVLTSRPLFSLHNLCDVLLSSMHRCMPVGLLQGVDGPEFAV